MSGALVVQANAVPGPDGRGGLPLPDECVDLIATSPPYLWKRKYAIAGTGELGNERDWREYLDNLFEVTDEMLRVLKPSGSIFVNLGDTRVAGREPKWLGIPPKSKLLLPERYRVGCQDRYATQGVIVRQVQIWEKANGLPESVTDRTRDSHEDWVHLTRQPRYYSAIDEVREEPTGTAHPRRKDGGMSPKEAATVANGFRHGYITGSQHPLGKLPGSVWQIPSEPLRLPEWLGTSHYAAFPSEWPRRLILGWSPEAICTMCNKARSVRESAGETTSQRPLPRSREENGGLHRLRDDGGSDGPRPPGQGNQAVHGVAASGPPDRQDHRRVDEVRRPLREVPYQEALERGRQGTPERLEASTVPLWPSVDGEGDVPASLLPVEAARRPEHGPQEAPFICRCAGDPPTRPAVILDCFGGTGTTAMVARALGRIGLSFDLSHAYSRAAQYRIRHDAGKAISRTNLERQTTLNLSPSEDLARRHPELWAAWAGDEP